MRYKTFLLDLDHTLFDSDASEAMAFSRAMTAAGVSEPGRYAAAYRKINLELWAAAHGDLYDGTLEVLKRLSAQVSLAMVTNGLGEVQRSRIRRLGIDEYFDAIVISAEVGASKPGTAIFDIVFDALGFPAKESAVMVGDNLSSDIEGGANYGIATCWYNPGGRSSRQPGQPVHEIAALEELLGFVTP
jgi:HAD superfamily hydrolase (TIGR01549 family)